MMSENPQSDIKTSPGVLFGARLQAAREALGLLPKDAAAQLRLNEQVIQLIEKDCYTTNLHPTFLRGYIRAYGKLLQIPETEVKEAIEPILLSNSAPTLLEPEEENLVTTNNYSMRIITYLIAITLMALVGIWWASHSAKHTRVDASPHVGLGVESNVAQPLAANTEAHAAQVSAPTTNASNKAELAKPATPGAEPTKANAASETKTESASNAKQGAAENNDNEEDDA